MSNLGDSPQVTGLATMTGRLAFMKFRALLLSEQLVLHTTMLKLADDSRIDGSDIYLTVHKPRSSDKQVGNWRLRWRIRHGGQYRHVLWTDLPFALNRLPGPVVKHYEWLNRRVEEVNTVDIVIQQSLKWCELHLGLRPQGAGKRDAVAIPNGGATRTPMGAVVAR